MVSALNSLGFAILPFDAQVAAWAAAAYPVALGVAGDPVEQARWLRHGKTWFVGVDALPTEPDGSIGGMALGGAWQGQVRLPATWHRAQLSVIYPGYPLRDADETDAAHRFRRDRDAAHLDGLLALGPDKRRFLREPHGFVLGIGLNTVEPGASPLVVWEGSHLRICDAFAQAYQGVEPQEWADVDVTEVYQRVRARVFETCARRVIEPGPGQAVLVHRLAIHGVAPWVPGVKAPPEGRMVAYFRPILDDPGDWLGRDEGDASA